MYHCVFGGDHTCTFSTTPHTLYEIGDRITYAAYGVQVDVNSWTYLPLSSILSFDCSHISLRFDGSGVVNFFTRTVFFCRIQLSWLILTKESEKLFSMRNAQEKNDVSGDASTNRLSHGRKFRILVSRRFLTSSIRSRKRLATTISCRE